MNYTFEDLKKQVISLDYSEDEITHMDLQSLKEFVEIQIECTKAEIERMQIRGLDIKLVISDLQLSLFEKIKLELILLQ